MSLKINAVGDSTDHGGKVISGSPLDEYVIDKDKFVPTGHSVAHDFVDPENVWISRTKS
jgi:hypothetical protein